MPNSSPSSVFRTLALAVSWALLTAAGPAVAAAAQDDAEQARSAFEVAQAARTAERTRIQQERRALEARKKKEEAVCYQRFSVEDCLETVRSQVRDADGVLRKREVELNNAERREKATLRMQSIEQKQAEQRQKIERGERPAPMRSESRSQTQAEDRARREEEARIRAA
ncbi:hypothetical protein, partial [Paracidovorax cattleyae]